MSISTPVSLGEALDKLSILEIKLDKITDNRRHDVQVEYDMLSEHLNCYLSDSTMKYYYSILKEINLSIWDMQDDFRYKMDNNCMEIIEYNDRRFRVKKKMNNFGKSTLREQKGYRPRTAFVLGHLGLGDHINCVGLVRYLSTTHDNVTVVCKSKYLYNLETFFSDDSSIDFYPVVEDKDISIRFGCDKNKFREVCKNYEDIFILGIHRPDGTCEKELPLNFYDDAQVPRKCFKEYFHLPHHLITLPPEPYVFVHNTASTGTVFEQDYVFEKTNMSMDTTLYVNPCVNMYQSNHKFYKQAQEYLNLPFVLYKDIISHCEHCVVSDSSFFCMSLQLNVKNLVVYSRDNRDYTHLLISDQQ